MRSLGLTALFLCTGLAQAVAEPLPVGETTYVERSLNHDGLLTIEHPPVARNPHGRRNGNDAAIAGFCRDGGLVRRRDAAGQPTILRQRELCDSIAPRTVMPGEVDPRPIWPAQRLAPEPVLRAKG